MADQPKSAMIRLDAEILRRMAEAATLSGRTQRREIEHRLNESLAPPPPEARRAAWPAAMATLLGRLAADAASQGDDVLDALLILRASIDGMLSEFVEAASGDGAPPQAAASGSEEWGRALGRRVLHADAPPADTGVYAALWAQAADRAAHLPDRDERLALQRALLLNPEALKLLRTRRTDHGQDDA